MLCVLVPVDMPGQEPDSVRQAAGGAIYRLNVRGNVYEGQTLHPMEGATVRLFGRDGKLVTGNVTAANGQFVLSDVPAGAYTVRVTYMGCKEQVFALTLPKRNGNYRVADVLMRENARLLGEAVVEGRLPEMTVVDDTVNYNADAFKVEDGAMVEELVKKLPGVEVDTDGSITWNGKEISQILVDGKEFFGNNRNMILKNIPAETIDKIKAYDRKSDHARITGIDDGNEKTVLDLTVKKNRKKGLFGNVSGGGGTERRYQGRANVNHFRGDQKVSLVGNANNTNGDGMTDEQSFGATMNWQNKVIELNGSIDGRFRQNGSERFSATQNFENKKAAYTNSHNWGDGHDCGLNFQYKVEWKPDSTWNILFRPELNYHADRRTSDSESAAFSDDPYQYSTDPLGNYAEVCREIGVNHRRGASCSESDNNGVSASLQVNKRLARRGRNITLNVSGGYNRSNSESSNYSQTDYYQILAADGGDSVYHKVQYNTTPQRSRHFSVRASYSEPLSPHTFLQMSYGYTHNFRDNRREVMSVFDPYNDVLGTNAGNYTDFRDSPFTVRDRQQCNYTTNRYQNHDVRLQLRINRTRYQLTAGISVQPQVSNVDYQKGKIDTLLTRTVANVAPTVNFRYRFSREEQLNVRYSGHSGQPSMTDMIPDTLSDANPLNIRIGNAGLNPSFTHQASVEYRRAVPDRQRSSNLNMQFNTTQNSTTNRTEYNETTGGRVTTLVNVNGNWNARVNYNFNTALDRSKYWRVNSNTSAGMTNAIGYVYRSKTKTTVTNRTRGGNVSQRLRLTYRRDMDSGWNVEVNASGAFRYNISRSNNTAASNLDHHNFSYGGSFQITTPWKMTIGSDISEQCRRGYSDNAMNTDKLIWNAGISQRLLPHRNLTLSVRAVDILGQRDDINRSVSATSRTDTQSELVRSYVLFSANLRFGRFGGRGGKASRRDGGEGRRHGRGEAVDM